MAPSNHAGRAPPPRARTSVASADSGGPVEGRRASDLFFFWVCALAALLGASTARYRGHPRQVSATGTARSRRVSTSAAPPEPVRLACAGSPLEHDGEIPTHADAGDGAAQPGPAVGMATCGSPTSGSTSQAKSSTPELLRVWMQADGLATSRHGRQRCDACGTSIVGHEGSAPRALQSYADAVALSRLRE